jgi:hypothetical protein
MAAISGLAEARIWRRRVLGVDRSASPNGQDDHNRSAAGLQLEGSAVRYDTLEVHGVIAVQRIA